MSTRGLHHESGSALELAQSLIDDGDDGKYMLGALMAQWIMTNANMESDGRKPPDGVVLVVPTGTGVGALGMSDDPYQTMSSLLDGVIATAQFNDITPQQLHQLIDASWGKAPGGMSRVGHRDRRPRGRRRNR